MPYPLFRIGLRAAALRRIRALEAGGVSVASGSDLEILVAMLQEQAGV